MTWSQEHIMLYFPSFSPRARGIQAFQKRAASLWLPACESIRYWILLLRVLGSQSMAAVLSPA